MSALAQIDTSNVTAATIENVVVGNDLSKLSPAQRMEYYTGVCQSLGLNPLTRPFQYILLNGKLTLYATKDATEQLRKLSHVSITIVEKRIEDDLYIVTAQATLPDGRTDESTGAVSLTGLKGEARANAIMKAETKAKRRVTLSICGLGILDESESMSVPGAVVVSVDQDTGEIKALGQADAKTEAAAYLKEIFGGDTNGLATYKSRCKFAEADFRLTALEAKSAGIQDPVALADWLDEKWPNRPEELDDFALEVEARNVFAAEAAEGAAE